MKGITGRLALAVLACAYLSACGEPRIDRELSFDEQMDRMRACNRTWREEGFDTVLIAIGSGSVNQVDFEGLGSAKQRRMAELVACLRSSGAVEPMKVEFYAQGRNLRSFEVANDIDFAAD